MKNKSEVIYFNDKDEIVDEKDATKAIIRELDENGNLVREVFGIINNDIEDDFVTDEKFDK